MDFNVQGEGKCMLTRDEQVQHYLYLYLYLLTI